MKEDNNNNEAAPSQPSTKEDDVSSEITYPPTIGRANSNDLISSSNINRNNGENVTFSASENSQKYSGSTGNTKFPVIERITSPGVVAEKVIGGINGQSQKGLRSQNIQNVSLVARISNEEPRSSFVSLEENMERKIKATMKTFATNKHEERVNYKVVSSSNPGQGVDIRNEGNVNNYEIPIAASVDDNSSSFGDNEEEIVLPYTEPYQLQHDLVIIDAQVIPLVGILVVSN